MWLESQEWERWPSSLQRRQEPELSCYFHQRKKKKIECLPPRAYNIIEHSTILPCKISWDLTNTRSAFLVLEWLGRKNQKLDSPTAVILWLWFAQENIWSRKIHIFGSERFWWRWSEVWSPEINILIRIQRDPNLLASIKSLENHCLTQL